jgi:parallel beta-helix repeat protein
MPQLRPSKQSTILTMAINPYVPSTVTANGTQVDFSFTFPYLARRHVKVTINGILTTAFTFLSANVLRFSVAPAAGAKVVIFRETPSDTLVAVIQPGGPIPVAGLNQNFLQVLYYTQEAPTQAYIDAADALKVNKSGDSMSGNLSMGGNKITGLGTASAPADAATKKYVDDNALLYSGSPGFTQDGTGAVTRSWSSKLKDEASVLDFGAVADGDFSGNGTDNSAAFQAAIDSGRAIRVPKVGTGAYKITQTLNLTGNYKALLGDASMPVIVKTTPGPALKIRAAGANFNEFSVIENLYLINTNVPSFPVNPGPNDAGVVISGGDASVPAAVQLSLVSRLRVANWSVGFYLTDIVGVRVKDCFVQLQNDYSGTTLTASNKFIGFLFDATPFTPGGISPLASIEVNSCDVVGGGLPNGITSAGYYIIGPDIRDIFFNDCETANLSYGWWVVAQGNDFNWDVHIGRPIVDAFKRHGIFIDGADGPGAITIDGGYFVGLGAGAGAAIYGLSSSGINVTGGAQLMGIANNGSTDDGVRFDACYSCSVVGNNLVNLKYGVSLNNSRNCTVTGNTIFARATDTEPSPQLEEAIRLFNSSEENVVAANTITGFDATRKYSAGIFVETGSARNVVLGNSIDEATVTTAYSINDVTTTLISSDTSVIRSNTVKLQSSTDALVLQGNSGTLPIQFRDGAGTVLSYIRSDGGLRSTVELNLQGNDSSTPIAFRNGSNTVLSYIRSDGGLQAQQRLNLQGSDGTYPIVFRDGAGNAIGKINNAGAYSAGPP